MDGISKRAAERIWGRHLCLCEDVEKKILLLLSLPSSPFLKEVVDLKMNPGIEYGGVFRSEN